MNVNIIPATAEVLTGETVRVEVNTNVAEEDIANILWAPFTNLNCTDCLNATIDALTEEEYTVTITDRNGCSGQGTFQLFVRQPDINISIP